MNSKKLLSLTLGIFLWEVMTLLARTRGFPHSWTVLSDLVVLLATAAFWANLAITIWLSFLGLLFGVAISLVVGLFIGLSAPGELATRGVLNFIRCIPSVVLLPLLVASIGSSSRTTVILTSFVVSFKLVLYVIRGIRETDLQLLESVKAIGMPMVSKIAFVYLPSTISIVGTGLRLSASRAFGTVIAAGIVAGTPGLGSKLFLAEAAANYPRVFSYVFVMGIAGTLIYGIFSAIEKRLFVWRVAA